MVELRPYRSSDYDGLVALFDDAYAGLVTAYASREDIDAVVALLPEAHAVAVEEGRILGAILTLPCRLEALAAPSMAELYDPTRAAAHAVDADCLFALEVLTHSSAARKGIGRALHGWIDAVLARRGLRAFVGVSRLPGLREAGVSPQQYLDDVTAGVRVDPSLSFNVAVGMRPTRLVPGYFPDDAPSLGYGAIVMRRAA